MDYVVFDLEFNQGYNFGVETNNTINTKCPFEIIQIGVVKLNENLETIGTLDLLIKPEIYTTLNPFVKELTGLSIDELDNGISFKEMYKELSSFIKTDSSVLCVWGIVDIKELFRNIEYYGLDPSVVPTQYINVQSFASKNLNCQKGINIGLSNAANLLNIPLNSQLHNALNDAQYTAEIFKKIYSSEIKVKKYIPQKYENLRRSSNGNYKIDFSNLLNQFEKMYKREMTQEEKSIIKLAYFMGKTNQFQIRVFPTANK